MSVPDPLIALVECLLLNGVIAAACWRFAVRRWTANNLLDAALLFYTVQYLAVGMPGVLGCLSWPVVAGSGALLAGSLWFAGRWAALPLAIEPRPTSTIAVALFAGCFIAAYVYFSRFNPLPANDALTYHFPAAVQWLQTQRISLLPTWFFNPSNTYSPLAGSMFIAWLMLPFQGDVLARFVETPVLLCVGLGMYALSRRLAVDRRTACLIAAAAVLSRPFLHQVLLGKDDLFVDLFFLSALLAAAPDRLSERGGPSRLGLAVGLLLATKYTALLSLPVLLLAANRAWTVRRMAVVAFVAGLLAGPWYLRNLVLTHNPLFPVAAPGGIGRALFTAAPSEQLRSIGGVARVLTASQGLPPLLLAAGGAALLLLLLLMGSGPRAVLRDPLGRAVLLGPILGVGLFVVEAPFPEARFVQPEFALLFVAAGLALMRLRPAALRDSVAAAGLIVSMVTTISWKSFDVTLLCTTEAAVWAGLGVGALGTMRRWPRVRVPLSAAAVLLAGGYGFVYWDAYVRDCGDMRLADTSPWQSAYPPEAPLWEYIADHVPPASTLAYTNTYLIYPLQGRELSRRVVYAPTRPGVQSIADLPWLGSRLSGEALFVLANRAVVANPDRPTWLANLRRCGAAYLLVMYGGVVGTPPEAGFAAGDPAHFRPLFDSPGGAIYAIQW